MPARLSHEEFERIIAAVREGPNGAALARRFRDAYGEPAEPAKCELQIRLFGSFMIRVGDRWEAGPPPMRGRCLIQFLALHDARAAPRERLIDALWPDCDGQNANHRLHIAVSGARAFLRRALDGIDAIRCVSGGYLWNPDIAIRTDVNDFFAAASGTDPNGLERAKSLYTGELLAAESGDWIEPLRIRCAATHVAVLERLAEDALGRGEYGEALGFGLELIAADRGHEGASRLVMRCFAALGRRGRALAEYEALRAHLRKHLGLEPTAETRQFIRAILGDAETAAISQEQRSFKA